MLILLLSACGPDTVLVTGVVTDPAGTPLGGVAVTSHDWTLAAIGEATTDAAGAFTVDATLGAPLYLELAAGGYTHTLYWGAVGQEDLALEAGELSLRPEADAAAVEALYAGCPGVGEGGAVLEGELRAHVYGYDVVDGEWPLVATGRIELYTEAGDTLSACYLDDEGLGYDPSAEETGQTGRFAFFGVPEGRVQIHAEMGEGGQIVSEQDYLGWALDGTWVPFAPLYVPMPGT